MPTAQRETATTAFRAKAAAYDGRPQALPNVPLTATGVRRSAVPAPETRAVPPVPAVSPRQRVQTARFALMTVSAIVLFLLGLVYLSGHAQVTREGYRRVQLLAALQRERDLAHQWEQQQTLINTSANIEHRARALGMVRADDKQGVTVGSGSGEMRP